MQDRRTILERAIGLAGAASLLMAGSAAQAVPLAGKASRRLRILVLGGTGFIGPHHVNYAVGRGHKVSVFNRGKSKADLPRSVERLIGDRNSDLSALKGREWDAVIDTAVVQPSWVRSVADVLEGHIGHYSFISSLAVYKGDTPGILNEDSPLAPYTGTIDPFANPPFSLAVYGPLKNVAIAEAQKRFPKTLVAHCALIIGPGDMTDRWTYWIDRVRNGGEVLAPGDPLDPMQWIDVRDLAEFVIHGAERGVTGPFNATGPASPYSFAEMLGGMRAPYGAPVRITWTPEAWLRARNISMRELPAWYPGMSNRTSPDRAVAQGLTHRTLAVSVGDTMAWFDKRPEGQKIKAGWSRERELATLAEWRQGKA